MQYTLKVIGEFRPAVTVFRQHKNESINRFIDRVYNAVYGAQNGVVKSTRIEVYCGDVLVDTFYGLCER
jgi:hypothetical protein